MSSPRMEVTTMQPTSQKEICCDQNFTCIHSSFIFDFVNFTTSLLSCCLSYSIHVLIGFTFWSTWKYGSIHQIEIQNRWLRSRFLEWPDPLYPLDPTRYLLWSSSHFSLSIDFFDCRIISYGIKDKISKTCKKIWQTIKIFQMQ